MGGWSSIVSDRFTYELHTYMIRSRGIPGKIDQRLAPSYFKKNLKLGLWGSLTR